MAPLCSSRRVASDEATLRLLRPLVGPRASTLFLGDHTTHHPNGNPRILPRGPRRLKVPPLCSLGDSLSDEATLRLLRPLVAKEDRLGLN